MQPTVLAVGGAGGINVLVEMAGIVVLTAAVSEMLEAEQRGRRGGRR